MCHDGSINGTSNLSDSAVVSSSKLCICPITPSGNLMRQSTYKWASRYSLVIVDGSSSMPVPVHPGSVDIAVLLFSQAAQFDTGPTPVNKPPSC
jgi:hypothetical protein